MLPSIGDDEALGTGCGRMPGQIEDAHYALPYGVAFEGLTDGHRLGALRRTAVHALDDSFELIDFNFGLSSRIS